MLISQVSQILATFAKINPKIKVFGNSQKNLTKFRENRCISPKYSKETQTSKNT